jgi:putative heme-binding domain-containing protein
VNGELYYSTNAGPFVHAVQGGYYYKSFGKHGPLHNLHAYHYFPELERDQVPGGPPTGGTIYLGGQLPEKFHGTFIAGNFLGHTVSWWDIHPSASTVRATYGGVLLDSHDTWFGPTDVCTGPDGAIYVSDFHDQRTAHPDPDANWDRSNGRIYKITAAKKVALERFEIARLSSSELVDLLSHPNHWYADRARVELAGRRDPAISDRLRELARQTSDRRLSLEALWALNVTSRIDDKLALELLSHPYEYVRYWVVRLVGDCNDASPKVMNRFVALAATEPSPAVRSQLAATAKRLPALESLRIIESLLQWHANESDPRIPWLIWWTIESKAISNSDLVLKLFAQRTMWSNPAGRKNILRLIRRYAAEGTAAGYSACLTLLQSTPTNQTVTHEELRRGLAERVVGLGDIGQGDLFGAQAETAGQPAGIAPRRFEPVGGELQKYIRDFWQQHPHDPLAIELALRGGNDEAYSALSDAVFNKEASAEQLAPLLELLREFVRPESLPSLVNLVSGDYPEPVKIASLDVLAAFDQSDVALAILASYSAASNDVRSRMRDVLFARPASALAFLQAVDRGELVGVEVPLDQLRRLAVHKSDAIDALVRKHWGNIGPGTAEEKLATMRRYNNDLRAAAGNAQSGQALFDKHCGTCHQLHGKGTKIGPDLTAANRDDLAALLANIVDPSAVIRREYMSYVVVTTSGRVVTGVMAEQDGASITILDAKNERVKISRDEIDELREADVSLMPERILDPLTPQELRDLFAYLQETPSK